MPAFLLKVLRRALYSLLFLAGLVLFTALVLTGTEGGTTFALRTAIDRAQQGISLRIEVGEINGTFLGDLELRQLNVRDTATGLRVNAESVGLSLVVADLFSSHVHLNYLDAMGLAITPPTSGSDESAVPTALIDTLFTLPVTVAVDDLTIAPFTLTGTEDQTLQSITGMLQLDSNQVLVDARLARDEATWIAPRISLAANTYALNGTIPWAALAGEQEASGTLVISGDLEQLDVRHDVTAPVAVMSTGTVTTGLLSGEPLRFDLTHSVNNIGGTAFGFPELENFGGSVTTAGTPDRIMLAADAALRMTTLGNTGINLSALYEDNNLVINAVSLRNSAFEFDADGNANFDNGIILNLAWQLRNFTDGDLLPQVVLENVNGNGAVTISTANNQTITELSLATLTGSLNGYPLTGNGEIAITDGAVNNVALELISDVNSLLLEGSVTPQLDLLWELQAPELSQLLAGLSGEIDGTGTLTGTPDAPQVAGSLTTAGFSYNNTDTHLSLATLEAQASYSGNNNAVSLQYSGLQSSFGERELVQDRGMVEISGTPANHAFSVSTQGPELALSLSGEGGYRDPAWQGVVDALELASPFGDWMLQDSLSLSLSSTAADIGNHCWLMRSIMVCGQAMWNEAGGLSGEVAVDNVPLAWLNDNLADNVPGTQAIRSQLADRPQGLVDLMQAYAIAMPASGFLEGMLDLSATFDGISEGMEQARLSAQLVPRDVSLGMIRAQATNAEADDLDVERYGIDEVQISVQRDTGRWQIDNSFALYLTESGGLDFQGNFASVVELEDTGNLGGNFDLTFNNIAWVEALVPNLSQVSGELGASGTLEGTLERPLLNMDANLQNGSFRLPEFGLALEQVNLDFRSANNNEITMTGSAGSGPGTVTLDSLLTMPLLDSRTLHVEVSGNNFQLLNTEEIEMLIAPDIVLDYRNQVLDVSGSVDVPLMHVDFTERQALSTGGSVDVSRDVVIVSDQNNTTSNSSELLGRIPVAADIRLGMGEEVTFTGYGLNLELTGNLELEQTADRPLLAHGELSIPVGSYELYGQRLEIDNGKLLFLGNPLNPALDIRAVRNTRVAEVGLYMNGTVRNIQAQLFSTPALPESEILSLLVTGNSFEGGGTFGEQESENMLGAIALLSLEKGQGLTSSVTNKLGIDSVAIDSGSDYRDSALGLGKYLSPNLFMRYDIGLFDRENALSLEYILTERLRLEVESGVSQSVDLTYTVEK